MPLPIDLTRSVSVHHVPDASGYLFACVRMRNLRAHRPLLRLVNIANYSLSNKRFVRPSCSESCRTSNLVSIAHSRCFRFLCRSRLVDHLASERASVQFIPKVSKKNQAISRLTPFLTVELFIRSFFLLLLSAIAVTAAAVLTIVTIESF